MEISVGRIISQTFAMVGQRFGALLGLWAVFFAIQIGLSLILTIAMGGAAAGMAFSSPDAISGGMILGIIVFYLVYFLAYFAQSSALMAEASPLQRPGFSESFSTGLRSAPTMLGVVLLYLIAYIGFAVVFGLLAAVLSFAGRAGVAILVILFIPAAAYLACRLSVVNAVVAVERVGNPITAIVRGWSLTKGNVLSIFLALLIFVMAVAVLIGFLFMMGFASIGSAMTGGGAPNLGALGLVFVGALVFSVLVAIVGSALVSVIHAELAPAGQGTSEVFA